MKINAYLIFKKRPKSKKKKGTTLIKSEKMAFNVHVNKSGDICKKKTKYLVI